MTFFEVLTQAINDMMEYGFDSQKRVNDWVKKLKEAAGREMISEEKMQKEVEKALHSVYTRLVTKGGLVSKDVSRFTLDKIKPKLRAELDRRIMASANLIKYNRAENISNTLRRFEGWATSIPKGGSKAVNKVKEKQNIRKDIKKMTYEQRRIAIDQSHKLAANIKEIVAMQNNAIAAKWHSHWRQADYNYRKDHKERDEKIYVIKNGWAYQKGYIRAKNGFTDDITQPGEEVFCRCNYVYLYHLNQVKDLLTKKGETALQSTKIN